MNCSCYVNYNEENFYKYVFKNRNCYNACILLDVGGNLRECHMILPIMIGSFPDRVLRPSDGRDDLQYGGFIIDGGFKIIPNFITNNLRAGYPYIDKRRNKTVYMMSIKETEHQMKLIYDEESNDNIMIKYISDKQIKEQKKREKIIRNLTPEQWNNKNDDDEDVQLLNNIVVGQKRKRTSYNRSEDYVVPTDDEWFDFVKRNSIIPHASVTIDDYINYFKSCIANAPSIDELTNKTIITAPELLFRVIKVICGKINNESSNADITKQLNTLKNALRTGNCFFALSNKMVGVIMKDFKSIYMSIDGQKTNMIANMTTMVKRYISDQARNSKALFYPSDGRWFICPLNTKEIKGAGETMFLSQFVVSSPNVSDKKVCKMLQRLLKNDYVHEKSNDKYENEDLQIAWEGYLTPYYTKSLRETLDRIKEICPFVSVMFTDKYVQLHTRGQVPMRFSFKYEKFITPFEYKNIYTDAFDEEDPHLMFSSIIMQIPRCFAKSMPIKLVVAIANIKGSSMEFKSSLAFQSFIYNIGYNTALLHRMDNANGRNFASNRSTTSNTDEDDSKRYHIKLDDSNNKNSPIFMELVDDMKDAYLDLAVLDVHEDMPAIITELYEDEELPKGNDTFVNDGICLHDIIPNCDCKLNIIYSIFRKTMSHNFYLRVQDKSTAKALTYSNYYNLTKIEKNGPKNNDKIKFNKNFTVESVDKSEYPIPRINEKLKFHNQLVLWTKFGEPRGCVGATVEDGIVLDAKLQTNGPKKLQSVTLTIKISDNERADFKRVKTISNNCRVFYQSINRHNEKYLLFGILVSRQQLYCNRSKNVHIIESIVNDHHRYIIYIIDHSPYDKQLESFYNDNGLLTIHYRYIVNLGVGSKIANNLGQKGEISKVLDMSHIRGWTRDGLCVHPQIIFSVTSTVGRTQSLMVANMINNPNVAITEYGEIIAPLSYNIHHIDSSTKSKLCAPKIDLMTKENGFVANGMTSLDQVMNYQGDNHINNIMHMVVQLYKLNGVAFEYLKYDQQTLTNYEEDVDEEEDEEDDDYTSE